MFFQNKNENYQSSGDFFLQGITGTLIGSINNILEHFHNVVLRKNLNTFHIVCSQMFISFFKFSFLLKLDI